MEKLGLQDAPSCQKQDCKTHEIGQKLCNTHDFLCVLKDQHWAVTYKSFDLSLTELQSLLLTHSNQNLSLVVVIKSKKNFYCF